MKKLAYSYLFAASLYYLILSIHVTIIFSLNYYNHIFVIKDVFGVGLSTLIILAPGLIFLSISSMIFGLGSSLGYLTESQINLDYGFLVLIITVLGIFLSIRAIRLLRKRNYSKSFFKFWCFISVLGLMVFTIELGLFLSNKVEFQLVLILPSLVNSIVIFLSARYLYRQQKKLSIASF